MKYMCKVAMPVACTVSFIWNICLRDLLCPTSISAINTAKGKQRILLLLSFAKLDRNITSVSLERQLKMYVT